MTTTAVGCGGDRCDTKDPWPLHHVRHHGVFCRLCTSCVLRYNIGSFCCGCFDLLDAPRPSERPLAHCLKCSSASHVGCLSDPSIAPNFVCSGCENPAGFSYFPAGASGGKDGRRKVDLDGARVLLAAARIAAASMARAAAALRVDAERKVREAALARKRAREMLEKVFLVSRREREEKKAKSELGVVPAAVEKAEQKKKTTKAGEQRRVYSRDMEKWRRFQEPIPLAQRPAGISASNNVGVDSKDKVGALANLQNHVKLEEEKKGIILGSQEVTVKEEIVSVKDENFGPRMPKPTRDAPVSNGNTKAILTGSTNSASLHS